MGEAKRRRAEVTMVHMGEPGAAEVLVKVGPEAMLVCEVGHHPQQGVEHAVKAAEFLFANAWKSRGSLIILSVGGFDADPREVIDIPEAMALFRAFGERLRELETAAGDLRVLRRLETVTKHIMLCAMGLTRRDQFKVVGWEDRQADEAFLRDVWVARMADDVTDAELAERAASERRQ